MEDPANSNALQELARADDQRVLRISRVFDASPETLFEAFTDPAILVRWWGPEGVTIPECHIDLTVGGRWRTCMAGADCEFNCVGGIYKEIDPPGKLAFTWAWETPEGRGEETLITLEFLAHPEGCEMRFTQEGFAERENRDRHNEGWTSSFLCLGRYLEDARSR